MNPETLKRIEENRKNKEVELDLSGMELKVIPEAIQDFVWLEKLFLRQNKIKKIEGLESLVNLTGLYLSQNEIKKIEGLESLMSLADLDISQNEIKKIEGLESLMNLEELYLSQNEIKKIEGLESLMNLEELYLSQNEIKKIEGLESLTILVVLRLSQNKIKKLEGLESLTILEELYLSQNEIKKIESLESLTNLVLLVLHQNEIKKIEGLESLRSLLTLDLNQNEIKKIEGLKNLGSLQSLYLRQNKIKKIEGLESLRSLQWLYLSQNEIKQLKYLGSLTNLEELDLSQNEIKKIEGLKDSISLQRLNLSKNEIKQLEGLESLISLQRLSLSQNEIKKIESLEDLGNLKELSLSQNEIKKIESLEDLGNLKVLNLSQNEIKQLEGLGNLESLQWLDINQNKIKQLKGSEIPKQLKVLNVSQNQIHNVNTIDVLLTLGVLDLSRNNIRDISPLYKWLKDNNLDVYWELSDKMLGFNDKNDKIHISVSINYRNYTLYYRGKKGLYLEGCNHLKLPSPEWIKQGREAVLDYLEVAIEQKTVELNEAKVMIVGRPQAGKTSLSIKIRDTNGKLPAFSDGSTRGIDVQDWVYYQNNTKYTAHLWDFGGQDVQYAIHQFFMTQRAIYLLVDCTRDPENTSHLMGETNGEVISNYWLETIKRLADSSSTFYLFNLYGSYGKNMAVFNQFLRRYESFLYPQALEVKLNEVSKSNEEDILFIRHKLKKAIAELPNVGIVLPTKWAEVRTELEKLTKNHSHISLDHFYGICRKNEIKDDHSILNISRYFHEIGAIIHYNDIKDSALSKLVILKRKWATEAAYKVILDEQIRDKQGGRFTYKDLERIWSDREYKNMIPELSRLLSQFEMCYELKNTDSKEYLIPQCLPATPPPKYDEHLEDPLTIRYEYAFLSYGIINRLTVRLNENIHKGLVWRQGMVLQYDKGRALVEEMKNFNAGFVYITVSGDKEDRWYLLKKIREQLDDLNETLNLKNSVEIQVPCICKQCQEVDDPYFHPYHGLIDRLKMEKWKAECQKGEYEDVPILDLIDYAFFKRPEEVEQSIIMAQQKGIYIEKVIMGDSFDQNINSEGNNTKIEGGQIVKSNDGDVQIAQEETTSIINSPASENPANTPAREYFRLRKLLGWGAAAIAAAIICYNITLLKEWSGLVFVALLGWGTYVSLTSDSKYLRYSRWVMIAGLGSAGILNGLPVIAGTINAQLGLSDNNFIRFIGQLKMDEQPIITIVILILTFGFAGFLANKDQQGE